MNVLKIYNQIMFALRFGKGYITPDPSNTCMTNPTFLSTINNIYSRKPYFSNLEILQLICLKKVNYEMFKKTC